MNSFYHTGEGQALVVRKKCNTFKSSIKPFKSTLTITETTDPFSKIVQYENSIIGEKLLAGTLSTNPLNLLASDGLLNFIFIPFIVNGRSGIIIYITGIYKKNRNYCSREIQYFIPPVTDKNVNNKIIKNNFSSIAIKDDEFKKILDDDPLLKKLFENVKK